MSPKFNNPFIEGQAQVGGKTLEPSNDIERLQMENEKLRAMIRNLEAELLNIYRKLDRLI